MDFDLGADISTLRSEIRALLAEIPHDGDYVPSFSTDPRARERVVAVCRALGDKHWLTLSWPKEYGGAGATLWEQIALGEEMWAQFEPRGPQYMGLNWVGPTIMRFGTDEQKSTHLPQIATGAQSWCQGFSEPEAGSDLASLCIAAVRDGDRWLVNGQKIWTSYAGLADYCFLAARTSSPGKPREGITIFLVPMDRRGIEVRPIDSMLGEQHLNELFFTDVPVYGADVLGEVDDGWQVIRYVMNHERIGIPRYARDERLLADLGGAKDLEHAGTAEDYARALVHARNARLLAYRAASLREEGRLTDADAAVARIATILLDQEVAELALQVLGPDYLSPERVDEYVDHAEDVFRYARAATIASGTIEILRMLVARSVTAGARA